MNRNDIQQLRNDGFDAAADHIESLERQNEALVKRLLSFTPVCKDAPVPLSDYCDMMHVCAECKKLREMRQYLQGIGVKV